MKWVLIALILMPTGEREVVVDHFSNREACMYAKSLYELEAINEGTAVGCYPERQGGRR